MSREPAAFFKFAGKRFALLSDLFYSEKGFSDGELFLLLKNHREEDDTSVDYLFKRLQELLIIDAVPGETARWELSHPVRSLLRFLLREQRLTSVEVLHGYLRALETSRSDLLSCIKEGDRNGVFIAVSELSETVERLRQDSSDNCSAVLRECMDSKAQRDCLSPLARFERVNRLWSRYLMPMKDLISVGKSIDTQLDGLESTFASGMVRFDKHPGMVDILRGAVARILRMRRDTSRDFNNSLTEILPLYESLKADSELARGASIALQCIDRAGIRSLNLEERFPVSYWRTSGLMSQVDVRALLYRLSGYTPGATVSAAPPENLEPAVYRSFQDAIVDIKDSLPVEDLMEWLDDYCEGGNASEVLRLYGSIYLEPPGTVSRVVVKKSYMIKGVAMKSFPLGLVAE